MAWHPDLTISVTQKMEVAGFSGWSVKEGAIHVQAPAAVLERMLTVRLHLDDCGPNDGPLRVIPGSHLAGRLDAPQILHWQRSRASEPCHVPAGGALLMRPLLLHSSSSAVRPNHRRVIHLEFAEEQLPDGLSWLREA